MMSEKMVSQANAMAEETRAKAKKQIDLDVAAQNEVYDRTEATVIAARQMWGATFNTAMMAMDLSGTQLEKLKEVFADLMTHHLNLVYEGSCFTDLYLYHLNGAGDFDVGARFLIDDHIRGFLNHATAIPLENLNVTDYHKPNPLYKHESLPTNLLLEDPENKRIPIRIETATHFHTGYLENFRFMKEVAGNPIQIVTTIPAIRLANNYLTPNSVYRWYAIEEALLRQDWEKYPDGRLKVAAKTKAQQDFDDEIRGVLKTEAANIDVPARGINPQTITADESPFGGNVDVAIPATPQADAPPTQPTPTTVPDVD